MSISKKLILKRSAVLFIVSLALVACSNKTLAPLYQTMPTLPEVPELKMQDQLRVPSQKQLQLNIELFEENQPDQSNYVNSPGAAKKVGKRPSVIIAVPAEASGKKKKFEESDDEESVFGTSGYYNEAEQFVEQDLLRKGFSVLDRSKFEAKLRDLRDKAEYGKGWTWDRQTERALENGEYDVVKTDLKNKFKNGTITLQEYQTQIDQVDKFSQRALPGKKRDDNEMNDIAEVIRAAQTGVDQADYLLQINEVKIGKAGDRKLSIQNLDAVKSFMAANPGLSYGRLPYSLPAQISSNWLQSSLNAKLIEIKSGSIVWLGNHEIESWAAEEVSVTFNVTKKVSNESDVNGRIDDYNNQLQNKKRRLLKLQEQLRTFYTRGLSEKKYDSTEELEKGKVAIAGKIKSLEDEQNDLIRDIDRTQYNPPTFSDNPWEYSYVIQNPIIDPDLTQPRNKLEERALEKHKAQMIKSVSKLLINTIVIK